MATSFRERAKSLIFSHSLWGFLLIALVGLILPLTWFKGDGLVYGGDFGYPMTDLLEAGRSYLYAWDDQPGTGVAVPRQPPYLTFQGLLAAAKFAGLSLQDTEKLILVLVLFASGASMYLLVHALFEGKGRALIGLFAAGLYMFNQYSLDTIWFSIHGTALLYALAPAMLACYVLVLKSERFKKRYLLAFNAVMLAASFSFAGPPTILTAWLITLSYLPCHLLLQRKQLRQAAGTVWRRTAVLGGSWILVNMWWILPLAPSLQESYVSATRVFTDGSRDPFKLFEVTLNTLAQITSRASFFNLLAKLSANLQMMDPNVYKEYGDVKRTYSAAYHTWPFLLLAFLTPLFAFVSLYLAKGRNRIIAAYFACLAVAVTFVLSGTYTPVGRSIWIWLLKNAPLASSFRDPEEKLGTLLVLFMALLFGLGIGTVYGRIKAGRRLLAGSGTAVLGVLVFVVYMYPFWTGEVVYPGGTTLPSALTSPAPDYYRDAASWLDSQGADFRLFPLPGMESGLIVLRWPGGGIISTDLTHRWLGSRVISDVGELLPRITQKVFIGDLKGKAQALLRLLSAQYALLHKDVSWEYFPYLAAPERYLEALVGQGLSLERVFGGLEFYKIPDPLPHIYAASDLVLAGAEVADIASLSLTPYLEGRPALAFTSQQRVKDPTQEAGFFSTLLDRAGTVLLHQEKLPDLVLRLMEPRYRYALPTWGNKISLKIDQSDTYALLGRPAPGRRFNQVTPMISGLRLKPARPSVALEATSFYQSAGAWKYFGDYILGADVYGLTLFKTWTEPLGDWKRVEDFRGTTFDLYETSLPEVVPANYTSQGGSPPVQVYRSGELLKPSWNEWASPALLLDPEAKFYELGNGAARRLVVQAPKGSAPGAYNYSFAYTVERLADEIEELVVIPVNTLAEVTEKRLEEMASAKYRLASISASGKDSLYVPRETDYAVTARISPKIQTASTPYWLPQETDWSREISSWRLGESRGPLREETPETETPPFLVFQQGFYAPDYAYFGSYRWAVDNSSVSVVNTSNRRVKGALSFQVAAISDRTLDILHNRQRLASVAVKGISRPEESWWDRLIRNVRARPPGRTPGIRDMVPQEVEVPDIWLDPGENVVGFFSPQGANLIDNDFHNGDNRLAALKFSQGMKFQVTELGPDQGTAKDKLSYRYTTSNGGLILDTFFNGGAQDNEYLLMTRDVPAISLEQYPSFRFTYKLESPNIQAVDIFFGIDFTGDSRIDGYILGRRPEAEAKSMGKGDTLAGSSLRVETNLLADAKQQLPGAGYQEGQPLRLVKIIVVPHKIWGVDVQDSGSARSGFYTFELLSMNLYSQLALRVPIAAVDLTSPQGSANMRIGSTGPNYRTYVADDGALVLSASFRNLLVGMSGEGRSLGSRTYRLKDGTTLTGDVDWEDKTVISLKNVKEVGNDVLLQKDSITLTFAAKELRKKQFFEDAVTISTPLKGVDLEKSPYLDLNYRLEDPKAQMLDLRLGVDTNGDGVTDATFFPGLTETLGNWQLVSSFESVDLYRSLLPDNFPESYNTERGTLGRFSVLKDGVPMETTWDLWYLNQELAKVKRNKKDDPTEVTVSVPRGTKLTATYTVSYLPPTIPSTLYENYDELELDVREALRQAFPNAPKARLSELIIRAKRVDDVDLSLGGLKASYNFYLRDPVFLQKWAFPLSKEEQRQFTGGLVVQTLFRVGAAVYNIDFRDKEEALDKDGIWTASQALHLGKGVYRQGIEKIPNFTFSVDMVEVAEREYQPPPPKAEVSFRQIDPTRYRVTVDAREPFWLVFNETFAPDWQAYIEPPAVDRDPLEWSSLFSWIRNASGRMEVKDHYLVNTYANGWYLESTGRYDVVIEYTPQRRFEIGTVITALGLATVLAWVVRKGLAKRLRRGEQP